MNEKLVFVATLAIAGGLILAAVGYTAFTNQPTEYSWELLTFNSHDELREFLLDHADDTSLGTFKGGTGLEMSMTMDDSSNSVTLPSSDGRQDTSTDYVTIDSDDVEYSETNIQVEGVDEPDIVKTDGEYLYLIANSTIYIIKAYPTTQATIVSSFTLDENYYVYNLFINDDKLVVFAQGYEYPQYDEEEIEIYYYYWGVSKTYVAIYDVSDHSDPTLSKEVEIDGSYIDARMIGDMVYFVSTEYTHQLYTTKGENTTFRIPEICIDNVTEPVAADSIAYVDIPEPLDTMTHILSLNLDTEEVNHKTFLIGSNQNLYVSQDNIYLTSLKHDWIVRPMLFGAEEVSVDTSTESTVIHKININDGNINYVTNGEVPGHILNQFSMDEYGGTFRIATTIGWSSSIDDPTKNNVYVLDNDLEIIGSVEDLAPGESIYSARFVGDTCYLVTFVKVDPFFVINLSDPTEPKVEGYLKVPGYSDYLHPYDDTHIIGIGKETEQPDDEDYWDTVDFRWFQGLKLALFDASDPSDPSQIDKVVIGDRGTYSSALWDHKAFLFDRSRNLLVIPVTLCEIEEEYKNDSSDEWGRSFWGEYTFEGAYVYDLTLEGFTYRGRITHSDATDYEPNEWYRGEYIQRCLYIEDVLYTISDSLVMMNDLDTLEEIGYIEL